MLNAQPKQHNICLTNYHIFIELNYLSIICELTVLLAAVRLLGTLMQMQLSRL